MFEISDSPREPFAAAGASSDVNAALAASTRQRVAAWLVRVYWLRLHCLCAKLGCWSGFGTAMWYGMWILASNGMVLVVGLSVLPNRATLEEKFELPTWLARTFLIFYAIVLIGALILCWVCPYVVCVRFDRYMMALFKRYFSNDKDVILKALAANGVDCCGDSIYVGPAGKCRLLECASEELRRDPEFVLEVMTLSGMKYALRYVDEELLNNEEFITTAVQRSNVQWCLALPESWWEKEDLLLRLGGIFDDGEKGEMMWRSIFGLWGEKNPQFLRRAREQNPCSRILLTHALDEEVKHVHRDGGGECNSFIQPLQVQQWIDVQLNSGLFPSFDASPEDLRRHACLQRWLDHRGLCLVQVTLPMSGRFYVVVIEKPWDTDTKNKYVRELPTLAADWKRRAVTFLQLPAGLDAYVLREVPGAVAAAPAATWPERFLRLCDLWSLIPLELVTGRSAGAA